MQFDEVVLGLHSRVQKRTSATSVDRRGISSGNAFSLINEYSALEFHGCFR